jgi:hypothetical protein
MNRSWLHIALLNFFLAATLGALLRLAFVVELPWLKFMRVLHAHSHVAMLGWLYLALFALLIGSFLPAERQADRFYKRLFWATEISVIGMLLTFPVYGYAGPSGVFSPLHVICSWLFLWRFWRDIRGSAGFSALMVRSAFVFMLLSAVGVFTLMVYGIGGFRHDALYYMAVQFFLHFQFNGWFLFALLALFFRMLEERGRSFSPPVRRWFYGLLVVSGVLTYALAVAWSQPYLAVYLVNSAGVVLQLGALAAFLLLIWPQRKAIMEGLDGWVKFLLLLALLSFSFKILAQTAVAIPFVAKAAYTIRNYVMGFFHLILLGMATSFILGYAIRKGWLDDRRLWSKLGLVLWVTGFLGSEAILFLQGTMFWGAKGFLPYYYEGLFAVSALMPVGVGVFLAGQLQKTTSP